MQDIMVLGQSCHSQCLLFMWSRPRRAGHTETSRAKLPSREAPCSSLPFWGQKWEDSRNYRPWLPQASTSCPARVRVCRDAWQPVSTPSKTAARPDGQRNTTKLLCVIHGVLTLRRSLSAAGVEGSLCQACALQSTVTDELRGTSVQAASSEARVWCLAGPR